MANKIKLIRPDTLHPLETSTASIAKLRNFLFKLSVQAEKEFNTILKNMNVKDKSTDTKISELTEKTNELSEKLSEFEERIKEVEESI